MTEQQQPANSSVKDFDLWKHLKESSALELTIPDPELAETIKKFCPPKEGLIK
ncbi:hypothetical protein HFZ78_06280 [Priestia megaterium]|jgi:hypothetical protein|uniref:Uncharacterized protein n=1 Tax=Priestia megaterium TaxID=1404 RepID=A0A6H1NYG3_PRIMG|nr:hypothetical protein [Priestia megaterium]QIZ06360.1 hypothetical protein HFZ78_06280 [Priestia megaterium]